ncbi:MAG: ATP-binding cassette domain-containing protein [Rhizobiaceae bacterium]
MPGPSPLLDVRNLVKRYESAPREAPPAVDDVSFHVNAGETLGLVGESGSGKSTIGRAICMLSPPNSGSIVFEGREISRSSQNELQKVRQRMQIVFQDPFSALNPRMRVGEFVAEPLVIHGRYRNRSERRDVVAEQFRLVGLDPDAMGRYPHQFSGGQRQRICIARALILGPSMIVADEPIAALDVSIQAQIVNLLADLQERTKVSYIFISHDLRMVQHICHRVAVLYRGRIVELANVVDLYSNPLHPYTQRLLSAVPIPDPARERARQRSLGPLSFGNEGSLIEAREGHFVRLPSLP